LIAAGAFIVGLLCFITGLAVEFSLSESVGGILIGVGALLAGGSRLVARRRRLPAP
jgi:hypothetical protein